MRSINIDQGWTFAKGQYEVFRPVTDARIVDLPHDYMIESDPIPDAPAGPASGFYTAGVANYSRKLDIPAEWEGEQIGLRFDGVMMNATIEINGCKAGLQHYGYAPFFLDITPYVYCGESNLVVVTVNPSMQPNCRWYSGAGIFRSLELVHTPALHLANDGIFGYTKSVEYDGKGAPETAYLHVQADVENNTVKTHLARVEFSLIDDATGKCMISRQAKVQVDPGKTATAYLTLTLPDPKLWSANTPELYRLTAKVIDEAVFKTHMVENEIRTEDEDSVLFGIRTIAADVKHGLRINGKTVKLKGGCVHHDNGILGSVSLYDSEERRIRKLKELGFNAIRTTHNPPSSALMEACDRLGMYVYDEAFDAWGIAKQPGDYNQFFATDWEKDLSAFIRRDRNHPGVILWSTGNEIPERGGLNNGYTLATRLAEAVRSLDPSRPVSNAICSFWSGLDAKMMEEQMKRLMAMLNGAAGGIQNADVGTADLTWESYTEAFANGLDIVGYNYMEDKYPQDHEMFPERVILGSENYPKEIGYRWPMVESTPYVIGDFTWTACDYIGEAGIGKAAYVGADDPLVRAGSFGLMSHTSAFPWRLANDADLDINGNMLPQGAYRSVVWGSEKTHLYSYDPDVFGKAEILSMWGFPDLYKHWNWDGQEGKPVSLMVFSQGDEVELTVNGKSLGKKAVSTEKPFPRSVIFDAEYQPGQVTAISYRQGQEISRDSIRTVGAPAALRVFAEKDRLAADGHGVCYVDLEVVDAEGNFVPNAAVTLTAEVSGAARLAGLGSGNPVTTENYTGNTATTFKGRLTAALRSTYTEGDTTITFRAEGLGEASVKIQGTC